MGLLKYIIFKARLTGRYLGQRFSLLCFLCCHD